ncbi:MAG: hypothetical protein RSE41_00080 [Clostridia bacterium]
MKRDVNSTFKENNITYLVVKSTDCIDCAFRTPSHVCLKHNGGECAPGYRGDGNSVKFLIKNK